MPEAAETSAAATAIEHARAIADAFRMARIIMTIATLNRS
jgi:hypothetical protein